MTIKTPIFKVCRKDKNRKNALLSSPPVRRGTVGQDSRPGAALNLLTAMCGARSWD